MHHCLARTYAETDWRAILRLYDALLTLHRSPVYLLNRAIVIAQIDGPKAGILAIQESDFAPSLVIIICWTSHSENSTCAGNTNKHENT